MTKLLPELLAGAIKQGLKEKFKTPIELLDFKTIGGGCINTAGKLITSNGSYFLKWNDVNRFPYMLKKEATGLELLKNKSGLRVPNTICTGETKHDQFLVLDFIESGRPTKLFWEQLGSALAVLHKNSSRHFGLDYDNYIGSLQQSNLQNDNWMDFFIQSRLAPQVTLAIDKGALTSAHQKLFEKLYQQLPKLLMLEKPALLHGDLWSGNVLCSDAGDPYFIDPAVYYGHREMELAYTKLFGGFDDRFYSTYIEAFPLAPGFNDRVDIYNVYPLLVHVNLFGGNYKNQVMAIVNRFV